MIDNKLGSMAPQCMFLATKPHHISLSRNMSIGFNNEHSL